MIFLYFWIKVTVYSLIKSAFWFGFCCISTLTLYDYGSNSLGRYFCFSSA